MTHPEDNPRLKKNNFDLLRLIFAGMVCLVHANELSPHTSLRWISQVLSSELAVRSFFVVSGFLIFMSYERSTSLASYAGKRIRRIYPAYFAVVMLAALLMVFFSSKPPADYFFSSDWFKYIAANLVFLNFIHPTLPGLFEANRFSAVNGALWTLKVEALFYIAVPLFVFFFRKFSSAAVIVFSYFFSVTYALMMTNLSARTGNPLYADLGHQLPGQLAYFLSGAFLYYHLDLFERQAAYFLTGAALVLIADRSYSLPFLEPFALAIVVVFFGLFLYVGNFGKYGDFSYGTYILHFPIIQVLVQEGVFADNPYLYLLTAVAFTLASAVLMWHGVEKRFLARSSHYIANSQKAAQ
ncbi:MAG TPA: acyltransferase [Anaerolineales bacterium]|nr:acyltransferase [Anaerolineales bacterium]HNN12617.1 acyltransferase [Anaerolineales bacterium]HNO31658.1 acyltransferase [Anaerolineales bacterium]